MVIPETTRLSIRPLCLEDVPELALALGDPDVMRYSIRGVLTEVGTQEFIRWCIGLYRDRGYGPWALVEKASGALVGFCGLSPETVDDVEEVHIGYRLARKFWGKGLATEAVRAVLDHAFARQDIESVIAIVEPDHSASIRVVEKAGFGTFECKPYHGREVRIYRTVAPKLT